MRLNPGDSTRSDGPHTHTHEFPPLPWRRPPVWMMRQAGRYMQVYKDLCKKHKTFRERSENVDLAVEISLQPWEAFRPDGVILFSDILTPLPGMGISFDITEGKGPVIHDPIRTMAQVDKMTKLVPHESNPYVGEALTRLRKAVGNEATVLGFAGLPFTMATYIVEGGSSKSFSNTKRLMFTKPDVMHALLSKLADNCAEYIRYQADAGAQASPPASTPRGRSGRSAARNTFFSPLVFFRRPQVVQVFDSWASELMPQDFDEFAAPYIRRIIQDVKKTHPNLPIILYISGSGGLIERLVRGAALMTDQVLHCDMPRRPTTRFSLPLPGWPPATPTSSRSTSRSISWRASSGAAPSSPTRATWTPGSSSATRPRSRRGFTR